LLLRAVAGLGIGIVQAAMVVGLALTAVNTALLWHLLFRTTEQTGPATIGTALIVLSPQYVSLHASAMSEPLFLFGLLLTLLAFLRYLATEQTRWLLTCSVLVGLFTLVRFTAPPLGLAIALTILLIPDRPWLQRIRAAIILAIISGGIFLGWCLASEAVAGKSIGRELRFLGSMGLEEWLTSLEALAAWLLPDDVPLSLRVALLAAVLVVGVKLTLGYSRAALQRVRRRQTAEAMLPITLGLFIPFYIGFVLLATAIEANLWINGRYAFPAQVAVVVLLTILTASVSGWAEHPRRIVTAAACLALLVLGSHTVRTAVRTYDAYQNGIGYASPTWTNSPTLRALEAMPSDAPIWSNGPEVVTYVLGRRAHRVPSLFEPRTGEPAPGNPYPVQLDRMRHELERQGGYVAFLDGVNWRFYLAPEADLVRALNLTLVAGRRDGRIYTLPSNHRGGRHDPER